MICRALSLQFHSLLLKLLLTLRRQDSVVSCFFFLDQFIEISDRFRVARDVAHAFNISSRKLFIGLGQLHIY